MSSVLELEMLATEANEGGVFKCKRYSPTRAFLWFLIVFTDFIVEYLFRIQKDTTSKVPGKHV